jgi:Arginase family
MTTTDHTSRNSPDRMDCLSSDLPLSRNSRPARIGTNSTAPMSPFSGCRSIPLRAIASAPGSGLGRFARYRCFTASALRACSTSRTVDAGDSDVIYADAKRSLANAEQAVGALLNAKTMPYILGGDHAITMATIAAFSNEKPIHIVHLDAHFDFIDGRNGITWGHGSPMRRASEMAHVKGITTLGPHNMASVSRDAY